MSRQAASRRRVLVDHVRKGKVLVPPFVHQLGGLREISWAQTLVPELAWIGLLHGRFGDKDAVELITAISRAARNTRSVDGPSSETKLSVFASASDFQRLAPPAWADIRAILEAENHLHAIREGLSPLAANYPTFPLGGLWDKAAHSGLKASLQPLKETLMHLFSRDERWAMMVQATAIWLWFDSGKLKVFEGLVLAQFPEIERYPETELSRQVGSSIRASLNSFFGMESCYDTSSPWPIEFWNQGLVLEPCELPHE